MSYELSLHAMSLVYEGQILRVLDQRLLPQEERWVEVTSPAHMADLIHGLGIRGAPLIGIAAALELGRFACGSQRPSRDEIREAANLLRSARPTAVNLMAAIDRMLAEVPDLNPQGLLNCAAQIFRDDVAMCEDIAEAGEKLINDGDGILTICNTGGLATAGVGTALGVIRKAHETGKRIHVYFCETRPLLQGARLTAWELRKLGIPHTLICDSMAAVIMREGKVHKCFVGADRIARNGDAANKIGTYGLAVLAHFHKIPFYFVAPKSTFDDECLDGGLIPIEERDAEEVRGVKGSFGSVRWAPDGCQVFNPAFDVTPRELVTGVVTNSKI